ncbi:uncharacterized protein Bfra_004584 [Botrytis fragariae]|uniref:Uncharacterized protein n=1 Tax=Botrytis fragariae TaxID=1964551 RepID=A0A8H6AW05_9HELO|nr:uncharacterized protein Bfra_004584 [Botrytis fragariae]KAF5874573.1 hypothetical protein Bfra_004584 [Botrytis fragariae]
MESEVNKIDVGSATAMSDDAVEVVDILMCMTTAVVSDSEAIWIEEIRQRREVPISDQSDTISCQDTISYRGSPTPEPIPPKTTQLPSPPATLTESDDSKSRSSQEAASQPLEHDATKRKREAEDANGTATAPLAKEPRQRTKKNSAKKQKSAAAKVPMTAEERKVAREAKAEQERQIYQPQAFKPRVRRELTVELDAIGVPLRAAGLPAELTVIEKKPRASRTKPKQA